MPPSYPMGMMSPPPTQHAYQQVSSLQYQYHGPPAAPLRAPPPSLPPHNAPPPSDYYIPMMSDQRSYPVNIPNSQQQPQPQPPPSYAGIYDTRECTPTSLTGTVLEIHTVKHYIFTGYTQQESCAIAEITVQCALYKRA